MVELLEIMLEETTSEAALVVQVIMGNNLIMNYIIMSKLYFVGNRIYH